MSPEQCKGAGLLDHRTDIYSLGVMIYEMLAGRPPFMAEGIGELFAKHMLEEAPELLEFAPQTPPAMAAAIMKSLNKELDDRFPSMDEFRKAILGEVAVAPTQGRTAVAKRPASAGTRAGNVATTMSPQAQSTTLGSASSEIDDSADFAPPKKKTGMIVGVGLGVAAAAAVAVFVMGGGKSSDAPKAPVAAAPAPAVAPPSPPPAPAKTSVTVRFEANPAGSHVFRKNDGKDLGAAPLELNLPHNGSATEFVLRKDGYKDYGITADLSEDNTVHVALEKVEAPAPVAAKPETERKKSSGHKSGGGKKKTAGIPDEDGLATPSF
jgi:serine/threonine-protein kinase